MADSEVLEYLIGKLIEDLLTKGAPFATIARLEECIRSTIKQSLPPRENLVFTTAQNTLHRPPTEQESHDLIVLSLLVEIFNASFPLQDDFTQTESQITSHTDQGLRWYDRPGVGLTAINDACLLRTSVMILLRKEMRSHPAYLAFLDLFGAARYHVELDVLRCAAGGGIPRILPKPNDWECESKHDIKGARKDELSYRAYLPVALALEYSSFAGESVPVGQ